MEIKKKSRILELGKQCPWIAVCGFDGSGKTTLVTNLERYFQENGLRVKRDRLPHDPYLVKTLLNKSKDEKTDRMLFAVDNRIFAHEFNVWAGSGEYDLVLTQRCFLDSFVHGRVQGFSYREMATLNGVDEEWMPKEDVIVHLCAKTKVAYKRIKGDPDADKFEYPKYMRVQEHETRRAYKMLKRGTKKALRHFQDAIHIFVDTTYLSTEETFQLVLKELKAKGVIADV